MSDTLKDVEHRLEMLEHKVDGHFAAYEAMLPDELRRNSDGSLDEVVVRGCTAHLEQMDARSWWLGLTKGKNTVHIWFQASKTGKLTVTVTDDDVGCWDHATDVAR